MTLQIKKIKTSSFEIPEQPQTESLPQSLQRTDEWHEQRNGSWNGSKIKNIMSCNKKGGSLSWDTPEKIKMFSTGIISHIYEIAMQRKTGQWIESKSTSEMKYGTKIEPILDAIGAEMLAHLGDVIEVGSKAFEDFPNARASSDGVLVNPSTGRTIAICEKKACVSWSSHYKRTFEPMDEKSIDFWQTQMEMRAHGVDHGYYFVASPPKDIFKYLNYDGDIMDLREDFEKECSVTLQKIQSSPFHQNALFERIKICENAVNVWIADGGRLDDVFWDVVDGISGISVNVKEIEVIEHKEVIAPKEVNFDDLPF